MCVKKMVCMTYTDVVCFPFSYSSSCDTWLSQMSNMLKCSSVTKNVTKCLWNFVSSQLHGGFSWGLCAFHIGFTRHFKLVHKGAYKIDRWWWEVNAHDGVMMRQWSRKLTSMWGCTTAQMVMLKSREEKKAGLRSTQQKKCKSRLGFVYVLWRLQVISLEEFGDDTPSSQIMNQIKESLIIYIDQMLKKIISTTNRKGMLRNWDTYDRR